MSKKTKTIIAILSSLALVFWGIYFFSDINITPPNLPRGEEKLTELSFTTTDNATVYDFMKQLRDEGKINFTEKNYTGMGKFIVSINGVKGDGERNWIYYVNGKEAQVGVSNYKIKSGDIVSWKYEKTNY